MNPWDRFRRLWPVYLIEAGGLMVFMISACVFATLLEHPGSWVHKQIDAPTVRRALMGLAMGITAVLIIYSPWGKRSGAHLNPAVTLTFYRLGKVETVDMVFYILFQFIGGATGVFVSYVVLSRALAHPAVSFVVTRPGAPGVAVAFIAESLISAGLMLTVLVTSNNDRLKSYTGVVAGVLVATYICLEAPLSGMSMNPARTFGSSVVANDWTAEWLYFIAPLLGMLGAAFAYTQVSRRVHCAKLQHDELKGPLCHFRNCGQDIKPAAERSP